MIHHCINIEDANNDVMIRRIIDSRDTRHAHLLGQLEAHEHGFICRHRREGHGLRGADVRQALAQEGVHVRVQGHSHAAVYRGQQRLGRLHGGEAGLEASEAAAGGLQ